jgi:uncharacterized membrane protein YccC
MGILFATLVVKFRNVTQDIKSGFLKREISEIFRLRPSNRHWSVPVLAALCVGIPLLIGLALDKFSQSLTVGLAGMVILYLPGQANVVGRMAKLLICSFGFLIAYGVGITFSFNPIASSIAFGVFSMIIHWISLSLRLAPPGNFFFIMLCAIGSGMPFNLGMIPERMGLVAMGTIMACFLALLNSLIFFKPDITADTKHALDGVVVRKDADYIEALIVGFFMFGSLMLAHALNFQKPYWIPTSCLAVMQGATTAHVWRRGFYRVLGTIGGMGLCWVLLLTLKTPVGLVIAIILLQYMVEAIVPRNYILAMLFISPLTILLAETNSHIADPHELIATRVVDVLIGSLLGAIGGWVVHHEKIRYKAVRGINITRRALRKKMNG